MRRIISILMENEPGALSRVVGLFSQRGYNIESLTVAPTNDETLSRLTLTTSGSDRVIEQITKQLNKLVEVIEVLDLTKENFVERELVLIKTKTTAKKRTELLEITNVFRAKVVDLSDKATIIEATGSEGKIRAFIDMIRPFGIVEVHLFPLGDAERHHFGMVVSRMVVPIVPGSVVRLHLGTDNRAQRDAQCDGRKSLPSSHDSFLCLRLVVRKSNSTSHDVTPAFSVSASCTRSS